MIRCNIVEGLRHFENRQASRMAIALGPKKCEREGDGCRICFWHVRQKCQIQTNRLLEHVIGS
jgi:hypothetical protein